MLKNKNIFKASIKYSLILKYLNLIIIKYPVTPT